MQTRTQAVHSCIPFARESASCWAQPSGVNKKAPEFPSMAPSFVGLHPSFTKWRGIAFWMAGVLVVVLLPIGFLHAVSTTYEHDPRQTSFQEYWTLCGHHSTLRSPRTSKRTPRLTGMFREAARAPRPPGPCHKLRRASPKKG